jgi:hypothetical protein
MARRWIGWKRSATNNTRPKGLGQVLASRASPLSGIAWHQTAASSAISCASDQASHPE